MGEIVRQVQAPWRFNMRLFSALAAAAIALTGIGIVGLLVSIVNWRRREIGVRVALGAQPRQVVSMIVRQGAALVSVGIAVGRESVRRPSRRVTAVAQPTPSSSFRNPTMYFQAR